MRMSFRWFGSGDPVSLSHIRQIPGMRGVVSAISDVPPGGVWSKDSIVRLRDEVRSKGLELSAIESVPVHEDIKLGLATRGRYIENFRRTLHNLGQAGIEVVCYNFMPLFDWTRSTLNFALPDGSTTLAYEQAVIERQNPFRDELRLPGWAAAPGQLAGLFRQYAGISEAGLWENLAYFLHAVVPSACDAGVRLAIHPDDPPWSVFGLPRIIRDQAGLERLVAIHDSPANGICFCTGSLGADPARSLPAMIRRFKGRINFVHLRNVRITGERTFYESGHFSDAGSIDMYAVMSALHETGFAGPVRPDHGRMIWGEQGRPGYGLYDRALGAAYLNGLWEAVVKGRGRSGFIAR